MIRSLSSFFSTQKSDYAIELALYFLIWIGLGLTVAFREYAPSAKGVIFIIVVWGILLWRRLMTFDLFKKWPSSLISWVDQWEEKKVTLLCAESKDHTPLQSIGDSKKQEKLP